MPTPLVITVNPMDRLGSMLMPALSKRMVDYAKTLTPEVDPEEGVRGFIARLYRKDPTVKLLAAVDEGGTVSAHLVAMIDSGVLHLVQAKADGNVGDALRQGMEILDQWARTWNVTHMVTATTRAEKSWEKAMGWELARRHLVRKIGERGPQAPETTHDQPAAD